MKNTFLGSLLFGAVVLASVSVNAQISDRLNVSGVITEQTANTQNGAGTVTYWNTKNHAFNTKTIIDALNASTVFTNASGGTIPKGSWLTYDGSSVWVTNKSGYSANLTALVDGSSAPFATITFNGGSVTTGHQVNDPSKGGGTENDTDANITATFQDGDGTSVTISGLGSEQFIWTKTNNSGDFRQSQSFSVSGGGAASYQGNSSAVSKGVVTGVGSGVLNNNL